jgi:hypothetical protein
MQIKNGLEIKRMINYFQLKSSEILPVSFLENLQSQDFKIKLFKSNKFDGFIKQDNLKVDYYPLYGDAFDAISILGETIEKEGEKYST